MTILTVYFCGTGSNSYSSGDKNFYQGELISTLAKNSLNREFADWIIIDGPGSGNLQDDDLWVESGHYYNWTGQAFGSGWQENVEHAKKIIAGKIDWKRETLTEEQYHTLKKNGVPIQDVEVTGSFFWRKFDYGSRKVTQQDLQKKIIETFRKGGVIPEAVNLVGWSRGGISCHMLANALYEDAALRHIPVRIFAVDPVPGPLNVTHDKVTLNSNVQEYVGFYAQDERSKGFACVIPTVPATTTISVFPMRGRHATLVGNGSLSGEASGNRLDEPGKIVRHFAEVCLTRWGAKLGTKLNLNNQHLVDYYNAINADSEFYNAQQAESYTLLTESEKNVRFVHYGLTERSFSSIKGSEFSPSTGLTTLCQDNLSVFNRLY